MQSKKKNFPILLKHLFCPPPLPACNVSFMKTPNRTSPLSVRSIWCQLRLCTQQRNHKERAAKLRPLFPCFYGSLRHASPCKEESSNIYLTHCSQLAVPFNSWVLQKASFGGRHTSNCLTVLCRFLLGYDSCVWGDISGSVQRGPTMVLRKD